jgi:Uma2 family endonuclease
MPGRVAVIVRAGDRRRRPSLRPHRRVSRSPSRFRARTSSRPETDRQLERPVALGSQPLDRISESASELRRSGERDRNGLASISVATIAHPRLDSAEYLALQAAAGWRSAVELIGGEAVVTPPSGGHAASAQGELFFAVRSWQETSGGAGLLLQDVFTRLSAETYLAPDIAWWTAAHRPALAHGALDVIPDLVVEVLTSATRANDLDAKRDIYLAAGIRELWLADPTSGTVTMVRPDGHAEIIGRSDRLTTRPSCPDSPSTSHASSSPNPAVLRILIIGRSYVDPSRRRVDVVASRPRSLDRHEVQRPG